MHGIFLRKVFELPPLRRSVALGAMHWRAGPPRLHGGAEFHLKIKAFSAAKKK